ncbi:tetratricopeptide repeat protein [Deinococcus psychrotolerans]|uniref:Tetratricopeptide repeat protein n=1 Tax=Deinococcus psychrotolerans TaxID=2489213 RepID=A0A3G8YAK7_9DEIO|nr:tetratricopeptide repeat protein [Deinococcus psychrotolerans]AZI42185.1 tetratricopeptide repeat protein [Deinococcus psychrotolerans]
MTPFDAPELSTDTEQTWSRILVLLDLGRPREAAAETTRALAHYPDNPTLWRLLSQIYTELDDFPQALNAAQRAVSLGPSDSHLHLRLGLALWNAQVQGLTFGRFRRWAKAWKAAEPALAAVHEALRLEPDNTDALASLSQLHLMMNQPKLAQTHAAAALHLEPQHRMAQLFLAQALLDLRQPTRAEHLLRALLADDPNFAPALNLLARVSLRQGRAEEAFAAALAAIRLDPANAAAQEQFRALVHEYLPFPFSRQSPAWRFIIVPQAMILVPVLGLGVWVRTLYRVRKLSPQMRAQIRRVRVYQVKWRTPLGLYLLFWAAIFLFVFALPHLPARLQPGLTEAAGFLVVAFSAGGVLWLIFLGVRSAYRWLRSFSR